LITAGIEMIGEELPTRSGQRNLRAFLRMRPLTSRACPWSAILSQCSQFLPSQAELVDILDFLLRGKDIEVRSKEKALHAYSPDPLVRRSNGLGRSVRGWHIRQIEQHTPRRRIPSRQNPTLRCHSPRSNPASKLFDLPH